MNITGIVITLNEQDKIHDCIQSLWRVCDEVIVVDSVSEDRTVEIAKAAGAKVVIQPFLGYGPQKRLAVPQAKNDWILAVDADEHLQTDAVEAIEKIDFSQDNIAYAFKLKNFVGRKWIKAAGFYPCYKTRLYNRKTSGFSENITHEGITAKKIIRLSGHLTHKTYDSYEDWVDKINKLTTLDALSQQKLGKVSTPGKATRHAIAAFFQKMIFKGGIFQGNDGFLVAITSAFRIYIKYMKLYEMQNASKTSDQTAPDFKRDDL